MCPERSTRRCLCLHVTILVRREAFAVAIVVAILLHESLVAARRHGWKNRHLCLSMRAHAPFPVLMDINGAVETL